MVQFHNLDNSSELRQSIECVGFIMIKLREYTVRVSDYGPLTRQSTSGHLTTGWGLTSSDLDHDLKCVSGLRGILLLCLLVRTLTSLPSLTLG